MTAAVNLGIDVACRAKHRASLADQTGQMLWTARGFRTTPDELEELWDGIPDGAEVTVIMEPTRNAWVPLAAWLRARGARIVVVPPEQSADLRDYYSKHTKNDRLDSRVLAKLPLLHPEGLTELDDALGPADALKRAVRRRSDLVERRTGCYLRLDALVELLGPAWADVLGTGNDIGVTALKVLERYADPRKLQDLGLEQLTEFLIKHSRGHWRQDKAEALLDAAAQTLALWAAGGLDFDELAEDIASVVATIRTLTDQIDRLEERIADLYETTDPGGIFRSGPGLGLTLAAGILGRLGDPNRFANLAGVRSFTGLVPEVDQSGNAEAHGRPTKAGDPGLRHVLYMAADKARRVDPTLAAKYYRLVAERGKHHTSALCHLAPQLAARLAACWRNGERYVIRDTDGRIIDETEGREICKSDWTVPAEVRRRNRKHRRAKRLKQRTGRRDQKSTETVAPASGPSTLDPTDEQEKAA